MTFKEMSETAVIIVALCLLCAVFVMIGEHFIDGFQFWNLRG